METKKTKSDASGIQREDIDITHKRMRDSSGKIIYSAIGVGLGVAAKIIWDKPSPTPPPTPKPKPEPDNPIYDSSQPLNPIQDIKDDQKSQQKTLGDQQSSDNPNNSANHYQPGIHPTDDKGKTNQQDLPGTDGKKDAVPNPPTDKPSQPDPDNPSQPTPDKPNHSDLPTNNPDDEIDQAALRIAGRTEIDPDDYEPLAGIIVDKFGKFYTPEGEIYDVAYIHNPSGQEFMLADTNGDGHYNKWCTSDGTKDVVFIDPNTNKELTGASILSGMDLTRSDLEDSFDKTGGSLAKNEQDIKMMQDDDPTGDIVDTTKDASSSDSNGNPVAKNAPKPNTTPTSSNFDDIDDPAALLALLAMIGKDNGDETVVNADDNGKQLLGMLKDEVDGKKDNGAEQEKDDDADDKDKEDENEDDEDIIEKHQDDSDDSDIDIYIS